MRDASVAPFGSLVIRSCGAGPGTVYRIRNIRNSLPIKDSLMRNERYHNVLIKSRYTVNECTLELGLLKIRPCIETVQLVISDFDAMIDNNAVLFALSVFAILSFILFYISTVIRDVRTGDGKPIISLFLKELGSKPDVEKSTVSSSLAVSKESELPDGWFIDDQIFNLEKRAIFSKVCEFTNQWNVAYSWQTWLCLTHIGSFLKPGDYLSFNVANYPIFLVMGKDKILRGFHDVCRHRAYKLTRKPIGTALVLGCKYHGWCYDTKGKLVKAPQFENVPGFNKAENSLFEIKVRVDANGFVFVNLDHENSDSAEETMPQDIDDDRMLCNLDNTAVNVACWNTEANFNWKLTEESYMNVNILRPPRFAGGLLSQLLFETGRPSPHQKKIFQNAVAVEISGNLWCLITLLPTSATQTATRVEILQTRTGTRVLHASNLHENLQAQIHKDLRVLEDKYGAIVSEKG